MHCLKVIFVGLLNYRSHILCPVILGLLCEVVFADNLIEHWGILQRSRVVKACLSFSEDRYEEDNKKEI